MRHSIRKNPCGPRRLLRAAAVLCPLLCLAALSWAGKKDNAPDPFYARHTAEAGKFAGKGHVHTPVAKNVCSPCHASAEDPKKLSAEGNELCFSCHSALKKDLKKKKVHEPFSGMPCSTCHDPHSSGEAANLVSPVRELCSMCHDVSATGTAAAHGGVRTMKKDCTLCHSPHASDNGKLLLEGKTHPSFEAGSCGTCHAEPGPDGEAKLSGSAGSACLMCHGDLQDAMKEKSAHRPFLSGACEKCHFPHVGKFRAFTLSEPELMCRSCHAGIQDNGHPVVGHLSHDPGKKNPLDKSRPFDCVSCHKPHASAFGKLLVKEPGELCLACHEQ
ncbi:MAG: cytochrome c3 family protein [Elusimicrobia bacterium]|nr:cytochrome c3 family protein [Elusimicrobiota bacterium]